MTERRFFHTSSTHHAAGAAQGKKKRAQVCVVDAQVCSAPADPDDQSPELTGFYQEKTSGSRPRYTLQVNQAGDHVRVWVRQVLHAGFAANEHKARRWRFYGRRDRGQGVFRLFKDAYTWDYKDGTLEGSPDSLELTASGITGDSLPKLVFERCGGAGAERPVYADRIREEVEAAGDEGQRLVYEEYYRLPQYDAERIQQAATGPTIKALLSAFFDQPRNKPGDFTFEAWKTWNQRILELDNFIATQIFHRKPRKASGQIGRGAEGDLKTDGSLDSWHASDEAVVAERATWHLRFEPHHYGNETRSLLGALAYAVQLRGDTRLNPNGWYAYEDFVAIKKLLRLEPPAGQTPAYKYTLRFSGAQGQAAVVFGVKGSIGRVLVRRDGIDVGAYEFLVAAAVAGGGAGASLMDDTYEIEAYSRWDAQDFVGVLEYVEAGGGFGVGPAGLGANAGAIVVHGSGRHVPLVIDLSGAGASVSKDIKKPKFKPGGGVSGSLGPGYMWLESAGRPRFVRESVDRDPQTIQFVRQLAGRQLVHFFEGDARLTPWGRQVLGMFCADELRALRSSTSALSVFGYTDPEGSEQSNQSLSDHRAMNTMQMLTDIAGTVRARRVRVDGMGELPAKIEGHVRNDSEDPRWRRVNVILDDHIVLELHVPVRP